MTKLLLFALIDHQGRYWWHDAGNYWRHEDGQYLSKADITVLEVVEAKDFCYLDHRRTDVYVPNSTVGWLSPDGRFIGCNSHEHVVAARLLVGVPVANMERAGWGRVQNKIVMYREPTQSQIDWAFDHNKEFQQL